MKHLFTLFTILISLSFGFAQHTFSIVAVDSATGEVGGAGATCLTSADCGGCGGAIIIHGLIPNRGVVHSQATVCIPNRNLNNALGWLPMNSSANVLDSLLQNDDCMFGDTTTRQYGIVDFDGSGSPRAAAYTGTGTMSHAGHRIGANYAIQGNILLGPEILDSMEARFLNATGPLADRLMAAMQGANVVGADTRCAPDGISSKSSFLIVAKPADVAPNFYLELVVEETNTGHDPIDSLQNLFFDYFPPTPPIPTPSPTSISNIAKGKQYDVWYNNGMLHFSTPKLSDKPIQLEVYTTLGKKVNNFEVTTRVNHQEFDVNQLQKSIYVVMVKEGNKVTQTSTISIQ